MGRQRIKRAKDDEQYCSDVTMGVMAFKITNLTIVYSIFYSDAD